MSLSSALEIRPARLVHIGPIANRMREQDRVEVGALGHSPREALRTGLVSGNAWTVLVEGRPEAMFGLVVTSAIEGRGTPWMLGTDAIYRHPRQMIRLAPRVMQWAFDSCRRLDNLVSAANHRAIRLLRRWGFTVEGEAVMIGDVAFLPFWMERGDV